MDDHKYQKLKDSYSWILEGDNSKEEVVEHKDKKRRSELTKEELTGLIKEANKTLVQLNDETSIIQKARMDLKEQADKNMQLCQRNMLLVVSRMELQESCMKSEIHEITGDILSLETLLAVRWPSSTVHVEPQMA